MADTKNPQSIIYFSAKQGAVNDYLKLNIFPLIVLNSASRSEIVRQNVNWFEYLFANKLHLLMILSQ